MVLLPSPFNLGSWEGIVLVEGYMSRVQGLEGVAPEGGSLGLAAIVGAGRAAWPLRGILEI